MSEPQRIGEILPDVMAAITRRCEQNPANKDFGPQKEEHKERVRSAVGHFMDSKRSRRVRDKQIRRNIAAGRNRQQGILFKT